MRIPYKKIKDEVLGKKYDLSLAFLSPAEMRKAMIYKKPRRLRGKVGAPTGASGVSNVLSFPLSKTSGEILICKAAAKPWSPGFLFIHGLFHLKGLKHGATMEREERLAAKRFGIRVYEQSSNRN